MGVILKVVMKIVLCSVLVFASAFFLMKRFNLALVLLVMAMVVSVIIFERR